MKIKKLFLYVCLLGLAVLLLSQIILSTIENGKKGQLFVNEQEVINEYVELYPQYAKIPLLSLLNTLEYEFEWLDKDNVAISKDNRTYYIDLDECTFKTTSPNSENLLFPPPGSQCYFCERVGGELIVDSDTIRCLMKMIGDSITISIDYSDGIVIVLVK